MINSIFDISKVYLSKWNSEKKTKQKKKYKKQKNEKHKKTNKPRPTFYEILI